eukprot:14278787-Heterocapsa_arctica.AAC.1
MRTGAGRGLPGAGVPAAPPPCQDVSVACSARRVDRRQASHVQYQKPKSDVNVDVGILLHV